VGSRRSQRWPAGALVKLLILTGARRNEVAELSRDEIKEEAIELPSERTKSATPHTIPLTPMMCRVFETLPRTGKFVLNGTDRPLGDHSGQGKDRTSNSAMDTP